MPTEQSFERFEEYAQEARESVDERISEILHRQEELANKRRLVAHSIEGGKRIRPIMTVLVSDVYGSPYDKSLNHAAIVEFIHNASLIADDRYDEDAMRRGTPTFHKLIEKLPFGKTGHKAVTGMTVMGANGLVALAIEVAEDPDVMTALGKGLRGLIDGFFLEGTSVFDGVLGGGYDRYIEVNKAKTGALFALAAWMPATYVDAPDDEVQAARKYGETVGILYQIADDIADDELPSYIKDPQAELEKWYDKSIEYVNQMPEGEKKDLLKIAPAWMVAKMFEQEGIEMSASFLPVEQEAAASDVD